MADIISSDDLASYRGADAEFILTLANEQVSDIVGDLSPIPARVRAITAEIVSRALSNTEGVTSITTSIDDWSKTKRWESGRQAGVYVTEDERAELLSYVATTPAKPRRSIQLHVPGFTR